MRLDRAVMQDVPDGEPAFGERARHQEATMAIERLAFRAGPALERALAAKSRGVRLWIESVLPHFLLDDRDALKLLASDVIPAVA